MADKLNVLQSLGVLQKVRGAISRGLRTIEFTELAILSVGIALAILVRLPLLGFKSADFYADLRAWYNIIKSLGFSAFAIDFSNYNPPYLYLLYLILRIAPNTPAVIGVKIPGLIGDFACAYFIYRIVGLSGRRAPLPLICALAVLFAPTMVANSAFWGQTDSIYTAALLACVYYLMEEKATPAMLAYGIALAFKLQAVFLAPLLFALFLRQYIKWKQLLAVPLAPVAALAPAWIAGRPLLDLLNIYVNQSSQFEYITMNAPSIYTWLPPTKQVFNLFYVPGVIAGAISAFLLVVLIYESPVQIRKGLLMELALISLIIVPFFLPKMHERYFFGADVLSIAFAFYFPQFFYVPIAINAISFLAYEPFLFGAEPVPLPLLAFGLLIVMTILIGHAVRGLYARPPTISEPA